jgi:cobalamin-dependent methionine synthase I
LRYAGKFLIATVKRDVIFNDESVWAEAKKLFDDAISLMNTIIDDDSMNLKGVVGLFPVNRTADGEDVHIFESEADRDLSKMKMYTKKNTNSLPTNDSTNNQNQTCKNTYVTVSTCCKGSKG